MGENAIQINGGIMIDINVNAKKVWNPDACNFEKGKCLAGIVDDSAFTCDEAVESYYEKAKTIPTDINKKKATFKCKNLYILLAFLLMTIALLIDVSVYCCLIKYQAKQNIHYHFNIKIMNFMTQKMHLKNE